MASIRVASRFNLVLIASLLLLIDSLPAAEPATPGMAQLHRLDLLPQFKDSVLVGSVSSYDRTGGNDDGFSGKYSFVAKEGDALVVADLEGPGVIYRIWTPTPTDDLFEFYFDGEATPRISVKFRDIFTGQQAPFVAPLAGYGAGGFYSYIPLPYEKSCKIVARAQRLQFYQVNYAKYPASAAITTWSSTPSPAQVQDQQKAQALFAASGSDISQYAVPLGGPLATQEKSISLPPGSTATLFESREGGRILGIRISPASALQGKDRGLILRMSWDGATQPSVLCPAGDFFGYAWGRPATKSLFLGTSNNTNYCYFPMPYEQTAKIEMISQRTDGPPVELRAEVVYSTVPRQPDEGKFHALWRRENPTTKGVPFTFINTQGRGHLVGCVLQAQGMVTGNTYFFEGDDQTTIDGKLTIHGTGSEDFFNGGWYDVPDRWEKQLSFPLSGCLAYQKHLGRTGGFRFMIGDAYAFRDSILQTIEHAPENNDLATDYVGITYLYLAEDPTYDATLPPLAERAVTDFTKLEFIPSWSIPIKAFTFRDATLTKLDEEIGGKKASFLRMTSAGKDWFGAPFISLECEFPAAGNYRLSIDAVKGPAQAHVQLFRNEVPAGVPVDLYAAQRERSDRVELGTIAVEEGPATIVFKLVGKNEAANGWGLDLVTIHAEKVE